MESARKCFLLLLLVFLPWRISQTSLMLREVGPSQDFSERGSAPRQAPGSGPSTPPPLASRAFPQRPVAEAVERVRLAVWRPCQGFVSQRPNSAWCHVGFTDFRKNFSIKY